MTTPSPELREVYSAANLQEAHWVQDLLAENGIDAQVVGGSLQNAVGELPAVAIAPRVWADAADFDEARTIVAEYEAGRRADRPPESQWTCPSCGEVNEPAFEICWSCQTPRPDER